MIYLYKLTFNSERPMESIILEIRGAEGGAHAKRLVQRQAEFYRAYCLKNNLVCTTLSDRL